VAMTDRAISAIVITADDAAAGYFKVGPNERSQGGRHANIIEPSVVRICRCRDFRARIPPGHVGTAAFPWPNAALVSDPWRSTIWSATNHRPVLLGRRLGRSVWAGAAQAAAVSDVGPWIGTRHRCGIGRLVHRPTDQGFARRRWLGCYGVRALISDQRMLGNWRRFDLAIAEQTGSVETGLSVSGTICRPVKPLETICQRMPDRPGDPAAGDLGITVADRWCVRWERALPPPR
jgi:hypothetical protein